MYAGLQGQFEKYQRNLHVCGEYVYSYNTPVAKIEGRILRQIDYYGRTTQKHINYAADQLDLQLDRNGW